MNYLTRMAELVSQAFQGNDTPEAQAALELIQEESLLVEEKIKGDIDSWQGKYEDIYTKHVELLKAVPSEKPPVNELSSEDIYATWKEGLK